MFIAWLLVIIISMYMIQNEKLQQKTKTIWFGGLAIIFVGYVVFGIVLA